MEHCCHGKLSASPILELVSSNTCNGRGMTQYDISMVLGMCRSFVRGTCLKICQCNLRVAFIRATFVLASPVQPSCWFYLCNHRVVFIFATIMLLLSVQPSCCFRLEQTSPPVLSYDGRGYVREKKIEEKCLPPS